ncbi:MAG: tyrosine-type recombinase/integrase [Thermodesulfobacteriota bacterium]|nr:tyrosine-type recombinase/integrase [Thermodesulfobacteriota bacterium]
MKHFESFLAPKLDAFFAYRKDLGYSLKTLRSQLFSLDRYLKEKNADWKNLQPGFFLEMRSNLPNESRSVNRILTTTRKFFQFLIRQGCLTENPLRDIPGLKENTVVPFVFSPEQTEQLLGNISKKIRKTKVRFLNDFALYMAVLLLARCGMRISEPLRLQNHHYRRDERTLYIERTKFNKDRLIPIPRDVVTQVENYLSVRKSLLQYDYSPFLLVRTDQKPPTDWQVRKLFHKAMKEIGLEQSRRVIGNVNFSQPTPHSLRHSFAVNTLLRIKKRKGSLQYALPVLATYMGHSLYWYTAIYLRVVDAISRKNLVDFTLWQERMP